MAAPLPVESYRSPEPSLGPLEVTYGPAFRGWKAVWWMIRAALFTLWGLLGLLGNPLAYGAWIICAVAVVHWMIVIDFRRNADIEVRVHRDGLRIHRAGAWRTIAWDDITMYSTRVDRVGRSFFTMNWWSSVARMRVIIAVRDGETIELSTALDGLLKVGARIRAESLDRLSRKAKHDLAAGATLTFGSLSVDRNGVHRNGEMLPFDEIRAIAVESGDIVVRRKNVARPWARQPYPGTPNAHLFVDLVERRVKTA